ncbi:polycomb group protein FERTILIZATION-INDEPENDENT ENDOSPERM-like [Raphanus sativus]|uniref:Polycomb group protein FERTILIZATION-INDEPENDENT ENDOSPERM-like n=1 Tax=Raphanus sativus TaxID=3726 RepID=A0A9W3BQL7_RAPSA|nr:polycomb group protein FERTILIZATION-INDEPENDENT ENDOSPERM-like [Raphanus sativus]
MSKITYKVTKRIHEGKKPLCSVVFNFIDPRFYNFFVTAGGNGVKQISSFSKSPFKVFKFWINIYNCLEDAGIASLHSYTDEDTEESFNTVSWALGLLEGNPFVAAGGLKGIIRTLVGHENSVNEIKTHPMTSHLVLSASMDGFVRLWNVETGVCILIFAGTAPVLSVEFNPRDRYIFVSCGMDTTIKIWSIEEVWTSVEKSFTWKDDPSKFPTKFVELPVFTASCRITMLNCNRWFDDFILSKSKANEFLLWVPQRKDNSPGEGMRKARFMSGI